MPKKDGRSKKKFCSSPSLSLLFLKSRPRSKSAPLSPVFNEIAFFSAPTAPDFFSVGRALLFFQTSMQSHVKYEH